MLSIRTGHVSITGNFRENNEDNYIVDSALKYFIVADGMGGQNAGEKASEIAVDVIPKQLEQLLTFDDSTDRQSAVAAIDRSVELANSEIMALSEVDPAHRIGDHAQGGSRDHNRHDRQPIQPVGQVHRIGGSHDHANAERDIKDAQVQQRILEHRQRQPVLQVFGVEPRRPIGCNPCNDKTKQ